MESLPQVIERDGLLSADIQLPDRHGIKVGFGRDGETDLVRRYYEDDSGKFHVGPFEDAEVEIHKDDTFIIRFLSKTKEIVEDHPIIVITAGLVVTGLALRITVRRQQNDDRLLLE